MQTWLAPNLSIRPSSPLRCCVFHRSFSLTSRQCLISPVTLLEASRKKTNRGREFTQAQWCHNLWNGWITHHCRRSSLQWIHKRWQTMRPRLSSVRQEPIRRRTYRLAEKSLTSILLISRREIWQTRHLRKTHQTRTLTDRSKELVQKGASKISYKRLSVTL